MSADDREPSPAPKRPNDYDRGDRDRWIRDGRLPEPAATNDDTQAGSDTHSDDEEESRVEDAGDEEERMGDALQTEDARTDGDAAPKPEPFGRASQAVSGGWNGAGGYSDASVERHRPDDARPDTGGGRSCGGPVPTEAVPSLRAATAAASNDSDASIHRDLLAQFGATGHDAADVVLWVRAGEVTLEGSVADASAKRALEDLAHASRWVKACHSRLKVAAAAP